MEEDDRSITFDDSREEDFGGEEEAEASEECDDNDSESVTGNSDSDDDEESSEESSDDDDGQNDGLSEYERVRQLRIARNQARLQALGLHQVKSDIQKSKDVKKKQRARKRQPTLNEPRRQLPGRSARATSFLIAEQSKTVAKSVASKSPVPKQRKIKKNMDLCWTCQDQENTGELHICDFCRRLYHYTCDSNLNKKDVAPDADFKCALCEKEGKNRRVPCGRCEGCLREVDCESCVYCKRKMAADDEASVRQKCIFRKCRNWGMRATVNLCKNGDVHDNEKSDEEAEDHHDAECSVCKAGGDLICCDGCTRVFHSDCHKPKIHFVPEGDWFCMYCTKKPKLPKEKKSKYSGPLMASVGTRELTCLVHFPTLQCLVCEGTEVAGPKKELDWVTCKICDDSFHLQCLNLVAKPNTFKCAGCKEINRRRTLKEKKAKPLFEGKHDDECYICGNGGNLVCCDFCEKTFHCQCHALPGIPTSATWKCCECAALEYSRKFRCGECSACKVEDDCGKCYACSDKPKFGGLGVRKQICEKRKCPFKRFAPADANESNSKRKHVLLDGDYAPEKNKKNKKKLKKLKTRGERLMEISAQPSEDTSDIDYESFINRKKIKGDSVGNMIRLIMKKSLAIPHGAGALHEAACKHLRFIVKTEDNAERAIKLGVLKIVSKIMMEHPEKSRVQAEANAFLVQLLSIHPPSIANIFRNGCFPLVLKSIEFHDKNVQVCKSAIAVFRAISYDFSNHWIYTNMSATTSIIGSMKINQTSTEVVKEGCLFLQNIICNNEISTDTIDLILSNNTISIIVDAILSLSDNDLNKCVCGLLGYFSIDNDMREEIGSNSSAIAMLLRILATKQDASNSALIALKRVATDNGRNVAKMVELDGIDTILTFLESKISEKGLLATGLGLLSNLTRNRLVSNPQLLDFMLRMRNDIDSPRLQAGTCSVIRNLPVDDIEKAKVANALVVAAMNRHDGDSQVQLEARLALLNLYTQHPSIISPFTQRKHQNNAQSPKRKRRKVEQGAEEASTNLTEKNDLSSKDIPDIKQVLRPLKNALNNDVVGNQIRLIIITALRNIGSYKAQFSACEYLRYLATSVKACSQIVKLGGLKMIHISMNQYPRKTSFIAEAINLLLDLISVNPSVATSIVQFNLLEVVIQTMYLNAQVSKVQCASARLFRAMSFDFAKLNDIQNVKGVEALIESIKMNSKKYTLLENVCIVLQNFLCYEERRLESIELITSLDVIPIVIDGIYSSKDEGFIVAACGMLAHLAADEEGKMAISDYSLSTKALLAVLEFDNSSISASMSTMTVLRLLVNDNDEFKRKIVEGGGIKTVADLSISMEEVSVVESSLELLADIVESDSAHSEQLKLICGIQFVTSRMKDKPQSSIIQAAGCRLLGELDINMEEAEEALKLVMSVMKYHKNNNSVQLQSGRALLYFCKTFPSLTKLLNSTILSQSAFTVGIYSQ